MMIIFIFLVGWTTMTAAIGVHKPTPHSFLLSINPNCRMLCHSLFVVWFDASILQALLCRHGGDCIWLRAVKNAMMSSSTTAGVDPRCWSIQPTPAPLCRSAWDCLASHHRRRFYDPSATSEADLERRRHCRGLSRLRRDGPKRYKRVRGGVGVRISRDGRCFSCACNIKLTFSA
jgi:hypothetical protein